MELYEIVVGNKSWVTWAEQTLYKYKLSNVFYKIPNCTLNTEEVQALLTLLGTRHYVLSRVIDHVNGKPEPCYILVYTKKDVVRVTSNPSKDENGLYDYCKSVFDEYDLHFYYTFSLKKYFEEPIYCDVLDRLMQESYKQGKDRIIVLTMIYPSNLSLREIGYIHETKRLFSLGSQQ